MARKGAAYSRARSATARRARSVSVPAQATVERDFSGGLALDVEPQAVPSGKLLDCTDFMLDKVGVAYKRGGTQYFGPAPGAGTGGGVAYAPFTGNPLLLSILHPGTVELYAITSGFFTALGSLGADSGYLPIQAPIFIQSAGIQYVVFPFGNGTAIPKRYSLVAGLTTLHASAPPARFGCVYKSRLVLASSFANENRVWFSTVDGTTGDVLLTAWNTTSAYLDVADKITGIVALMNSMLVFTRNSVERIVGDTPPPGGNMDRGEIAALGCLDARSIVSTGRSVIFANELGVYATSDGISFSDLTQEGLITSYWRSLTTEIGLLYTAGMLGDLYVISIIRPSTNAFVGGLICNVPRRAWWKFTNVKGAMYTTPIASASDVGDPRTPELFVSDRTSNRLLALGGFRFGQTGAGLDADGTAVLPTLTTRYFGSESPWRKHFTDARFTYDLSAVTAGGTPYLTLTDTDMQGTVGNVVNSPLTGSGQQAPVRRRLPLNRVARSLKLAFTQTAKSDYTELFAVEVDSRDLPPSMLGEV